MADVHDDVAETSELGSSHMFCEEITNHLISWTVFNCNVLAFLYISNKEISDVCVPCSFAAQCSSICFKLFTTQVILMYLCWPERISLSIKEVKHPQDD